MIVSYDVVDAKKYEGYVPGVLPLLTKHGAEVVVADYDVRVLEGEKRGVYVVLRFPSEEAAMGFYDDPDYEPVRKIRLESTANGNFVMASEFVPPSA